MTDPKERLGRKKQEAVVALLSNRNIEEAARASNTPARTLYRWLKEPDFDAAFRPAKRQAFGQSFVPVKEMEALPSPSTVGSTRVGGIDFNRPRIWRVARSLLALAASPRGFSVSELVYHVRAQSSGEVEYRPRQAAYDLKKFQGQADGPAGLVGVAGTSRHRMF